ncbi:MULTISPECIES: glutaredoxin family protein [unclassified Synechococcus]|uniref:glutaredoxin family protein n=1 Tax=unclassified Synechococcus TaxID=2626047 RepID=UPI0021A82BBE|nr:MULTISPECIES: glutaredoxin family protein [unclassified Synechococcus]MCT0212906.1 glutaredoxin family protein [Synechococcus sp. CS-1326]MCT0233110.1 glutaredoxin family protein [Synechococcus sp. CS-1327]
MQSRPSLILYSRANCCLCQGLAERLGAIRPALDLRVMDVDGDPALQARYGLQVPVLAVQRQGTWHDLPRVSPRLTGERLARWLQESLAALPPTAP